jgi:uncharacterized membrane protein
VNPELIILRLLHILGAIVWVGSGVFTTFFLFPALRPGSPGFADVMGGLQRRKLFTFLPIAALVTMLSGARLLQIISDGFSPAYFELRSGRIYAMSALAAILAFLLSMIVSRPAGVKAGVLAAQRQAATSDQERARIDATLATLRRRGSLSTAIAMGLLIAAAAGMAVARYL